jgi:hypothetical protein
MGSGLDRQKREKVLDTLSRCFVFSEVLVNDRNIPVCLGSFICLCLSPSYVLPPPASI